MATLGRSGDADAGRAVRRGAGRRAAGRRHHARLRAGARHPHQPEESGHRRSRARRDAADGGAARARRSSAALQDAGVAACGKHFPGHGDTSTDSHLELPLVEHPPDRLRAVEFVPFRAAIAEQVALHHDRARARAVARRASGRRRSRAGIVSGCCARSSDIDGVILSDDLEMKAVSARRIRCPRRRSQAIEAGCDGVLICSGDVDLQAAALEALVHAVEDGAIPRDAVDDALRAAAAGEGAVLVATDRRAAIAQRRAAAGARLRGASPRRRRDGGASCDAQAARACRPAIASRSSPRPAPSSATSSTRASRSCARLGFEPVYDESVFERGRFVPAPPDLRARRPHGAWRRPVDRGADRRARRLRQRAAAAAARSGGDARRPKAADRLQRHHRAADLVLTPRRVAMHGPMIEGRLANGPAALRRRRRSSARCRGRAVGGSRPTGSKCSAPGEAAGRSAAERSRSWWRSLGTPWAFDPPAGCVLFLEDVGERPYRLHGMLTQLRRAACSRGAARSCSASSPAATSPAASCDRGRADATSSQDFPGPVLFGFPSGHTTGRVTLPFGVGPRRRPTVAAATRHRGTGSRVNDANSSDWRLRHGDGARWRRCSSSAGHDVSGSDEHVYPPMSDFLAAEGIHAARGLSRRAHRRAELDLVVVGNAISRGNAELEAVLDRKIRYCSLPEAIRDHFLWGARSIVIAGTHGKTTTTSLTGWLLTHGGAGSDGAGRRHRAQFRRRTAPATAWGKGEAFVIEGDEYDSAYFDKTAKFLKYLPDIAVVNNIEFDHADIYADLDAVRLAFRRLVNLVPARRADAARRRQPGCGGAGAVGAKPRPDVRAVRDGGVAGARHHVRVTGSRGGIRRHTGQHVSGDPRR